MSKTLPQLALSPMSKSPVLCKSWEALVQHQQRLKRTSIESVMQTPGRMERFTVKLDGLLFDFSKHHVDEPALQALLDLCDEQGLSQWRERMFTGDKINSTENRAVLHTALRRPAHDKVMVDGENIMPFIHEVLSRMKAFSNAVRSGAWKGFTGKPIAHIVNIGIGGSDLGPFMVCETLKPYIPAHLKMHFVSNVDGTHLAETLKQIDPETTLFIIASKTFTTQETMANAKAAKDWMIEKLGSSSCTGQHFCALSTNEQSIADFGIKPQNMFPFRDWVGGRYSLWSSIGLSICLGVGFENFEKLLAGGRTIDQHFCTAPSRKNIPVLMAVLGLWYRNFWDYPSYAVLPYDQYLHRFPAFLQQMDMESNGKYVDRNNQVIRDYKTGPVLFGEPGTNGQHAFYQLIHQGSDIIPCDFITAKTSHNPIGNQHTLLLNNMLAQAQALMQGRSLEQASGNPHRVFEGNRPSSILLFDQITPYTLGMLIALYEHKVFVQGILWNINSYDQFGVELGKELANNIEKGKTEQLDPSTRALLDYMQA
jgi:glucose-6-phosphate isomerase